MYDKLCRQLRAMASTWGISLPREAADAIEAMCEMVETAHGELANVIQSYEESKPGWIPVTERLPEAGERVLCYCRANIYEVMKMRTDGAWVHNDTVYDSAYMSGFVTHWMPLPEPPQKGEGE